MKKILIVTAILFTTVLSANAQTKAEFNKTLNAYFNTKNALAKDNVALAGASAKTLLSSVEKLSSKQLTTEQRADFDKQKGEIKKYVEPIVTEKDLKAQRKNFEYVSSAIIKLTKSLQLNNATVYIQYCPMVKRSWLNEVEDVQNPFYGSKMYDCGEVTETLAKK